MASENQIRDDLDATLRRLAGSPFRGRLRLDDRDRGYLERTGREAVLDHARDFITGRLAPARPRNDGSQTPMRGHPVFVAQHATATCCRGCLEKWHGIRAGRALTDEQQEFAVALIAHWLDAEVRRPAPATTASATKSVPTRRKPNKPRPRDAGANQGDLFSTDQDGSSTVDD